MNKVVQKCVICKREMSLTEFYRDVRTPNGFRYECRMCFNHMFDDCREKNQEKYKKITRRWKRENRVKVLNSRKKYNSSPHNKIAYNFRYLMEKLVGEKTPTLTEMVGAGPKTIYEYLCDILPKGLYPEDIYRTWDIGFVVPPTNFDLTTEEGRLAAFNIKNLVPKVRI